MSDPKDHEASEESNVRVFLSYSRDDRDRAVKIIGALEGAGFEVWWDGLLTGGETFLQTTEQMLEISDAVVVLWTATSVTSHWVRDEATRGRERNCLVPVSLDGSTPPLGFRQIHYVDFSKWKGQAGGSEIAELVRAIRQVNASGTQFSDPLVGKSAANLKVARRISRRSLVIGGSAVLAASGTIAGWKVGLFGTDGNVNSIAVMPFRNLSADPGKSYLSDGLAEELRAMLSVNRQIEVSAQSSSNSVREENLAVSAIASKLGVAYVLEGSVQVAGEQMRVVARLIGGKDGFQKWSQVFDRKLNDVLALQSEIATAVTDALVSTILGAQKTKSERIGGTKNAKAFDAYLRASALFALAQDEKTDRQSLANFEEAIRLDPDYALARAARARGLLVVGGSYASGADMPRLLAEAEVEARKSVELAPDMLEGQAVLGQYLYSKLDLAAAREPMERSKELGFGHAGILNHYALFAAYLTEFDKAREALVRAKRLDPLNANVWRTACQIEYQARNFSQAEAEARNALSMNSKINVANRTLGDIALVRKDYHAAKASFEAEPSTLSRLRGLAIAEFKLGNPIEAQQKLDQLVTSFGTNSSYQQAQVFAQWGDTVRALEMLEQAYEIRDSGLLFLGGDVLVDPVRKEPRFAAIMAKIGFFAEKSSLM